MISDLRSHSAEVAGEVLRRALSPKKRRYVDDAFAVRASELYACGVPRTTRLMNFDFERKDGLKVISTLRVLENTIECTVSQWLSSNDLEPVLGQESDITVSWSDLNYGGRRPWLHCSRCDRRYATLYLEGFFFICRICARLKYSSKYEPNPARRRRAKRLRANLDPPLTRGGPPTRPKGMHQATFERRLEEIRDLERRSRR
ncbi:MAG TPA: hypothetical protein VIL92_13810 [Gaiellaceae bacterium]